jgi:hypothetical protein
MGRLFVQVLELSESWTDEQRQAVAASMIQQSGATNTKRSAEVDPQEVLTYSPRQSMPMHTWAKKGSRTDRLKPDSNGFGMSATIVDLPTSSVTSSAAANTLVCALVSTICA